MDGGRIELTALGAPLRSDVPGSMRDAVLFLVGEWCWRAWGDLLHSVRTGEPAFDRAFGMSNFEYWEQNPEAGAIHDAYFRAISRTTSAPIVAAYDFSRFGTVVDVGGGTGALLAAILRAHRGVRRVIFDLPHVVAGAGPVLAEAEVAASAGGRGYRRRLRIRSVQSMTRTTASDRSLVFLRGRHAPPPTDPRVDLPEELPPVLRLR